MSKFGSKLRTLKKVTVKVQHGILKTNIPAGMAAAGPPLGPMLGQVTINLNLYYSCNTINCSEELTLLHFVKILMSAPKT